MGLPRSHFQVLLALADGDHHGYAIMRRAEDHDERLGPGALYTALGRLLDAALIEELDERPAPDLDDSRRRYYRITRKGRAALLDELARLQAVLDRATAAGVWSPSTA